MKNLKILAVLALLIMSVFTSVVSAADQGPLPLRIENVWVNDKLLSDNKIRSDMERGEKIEIEVEMYAEQTIDNVVVEASLVGYEHSDDIDADDKETIGKVTAGRTYYETLTIELPEELENEDEYALRIEVADQAHARTIRNFLLVITTPEHSMKIADVLLSPGLTVEAGRSLLASVRVENFGQRTEDNVKVTLSIPELGIADYDYIEEVESDDEKMTEELYVRIPADAENKDYDAKVIIDYDDGYETVEKTMTIKVVGGKAVEEAGKTVLTVGPETQNIVAGGNEAVYPIAITNAGSDSKTYTLTLTTGDWATSRLSDNVVVLKAGETKAAYAYVSADKDASAGEKVVGLKVTSGDETLKEVTLKANVVANSSWGNFKKALEIGLVVLVVLLVIIGLIVGFSRMKNKDNEDSEEDSDKKTYY